MSPEPTNSDALLSDVEFDECLQRIRNLVEWFALGGCVPTESIWD